MPRSIDPKRRDSHDWTGEPDFPSLFALIAAMAIAAAIFLFIGSGDMLH